MFAFQNVPGSFHHCIHNIRNSFLMSEELQRPSVIDIEALPAAGRGKSFGREPALAGNYDEISESRRADDVLAAQGDWQSELKPPIFAALSNCGPRYFRKIERSADRRGWPKL